MKEKLRKFIGSKKTTIVTLVILLTPLLIFGGILLRDKLQTGTPVIGSRNDDQLANKITDEHLTKIEDALADDMILKKKVALKSSTLRVYLEVSDELSKDVMKTLGEGAYDKIAEILPIEDYFTIHDTTKQYDLEIHVYNNVEDKDSDAFVYLEIMRGSSMEETKYVFVTDAKNPEFKEEVLEIMNNSKETEEEESGDE